MFGPSSRFGYFALPLILWLLPHLASGSVQLRIPWKRDLRSAPRYVRDAQPLLAVSVLGCAVVAITPIAWTYDLLWLGAAGAGRLGRRVEDRSVWPVVAAMPALFTSALFDPKVEPVSSFVLRNAPGLLALLVACLLPFRLRNDPLWRVVRTAVPAVVHRPFGRRWLQVLPSCLRSARRPNLLLKLLFIQVGYGVYTWIRNIAPSRVHEAVANGQDVLRAEHVVHLDIERSLNRAVLASDWLTQTLEKYYKTLHFAVPLAVLAWLHSRLPQQYRTARTVLFATTGLALIGFWAYPLAPPRLTPGHGFHDSLRPGGDTDPFGAFPIWPTSSPPCRYCTSAGRRGARSFSSPPHRTYGYESSARSTRWPPSSSCSAPPTTGCSTQPAAW